MRFFGGNFSKISKFIVLNLAIVFTTFEIASPAHAIDLSAVSVTSSENISTAIEANVSNVYLNTFKPNVLIFFKVNFNNSDTLTVINQTSKVVIQNGSGIQFSIKSGSSLNLASISKPIWIIKNESGQPLIQFFAAPKDFPKISYTGDTSLIKSKDILSTPVVSDGTYAIDSQGTNIKFFTKSPNNLVGFRKLNDGPVNQGFGGTAAYAYLEQQDFSVSATSPGAWRLLDSNFQVVQRINVVKTKFGNLLPEGHGMTISSAGNPIVITAVTRSVDSTWLKRSYKLPILDCDIAEIKNGVAIKEFSFWDWAVSNKAISEPLLDSMQLFNDPQNPTSSPIDICHANSMEYYKVDNTYLISLRSPSIIIILDATLKNVKQILNTDTSLQHFARYVSKNHISALGNFTFDKVSKFLDFKFVNGSWKLTETPFPVHVTYCGNTEYLDATHIWLGGGCGPFTPGVLGAIYKISNNEMSLVGSMKMNGFNYSYRADVI